MIEKTCPFSMGGEITNCLKEECKVYENGDCVLTKMALSLYYIARNLKEIREETCER